MDRGRRGDGRGRGYHEDDRRPDARDRIQKGGDGRVLTGRLVQSGAVRRLLNTW